MNIYFKIIQKEAILQIIPVLQKLNTKTPEHLLKERVLEMAEYPHYECAGVFDDDKLIGICGLWHFTRHYVGKSIELDHLIIDESYRGHKIGERFFSWLEAYTKSKGFEAIELNTYTGNRKSHKFYYNQGYEIYGFHFVKVTRKDKNFY